MSETLPLAQAVRSFWEGLKPKVADHGRFRVGRSEAASDDVLDSRDLGGLQEAHEARPLVRDGDWPLSLVVPIYNVEPFLAQCLDSVAAQEGFEAVDVILVDDGSFDGSSAIAEEFANRHANVRLVRQANAGLGAARNTGLAMAQGEFVGFLDSDDVLPPQALSNLYGVTNDDVDVAVGQMASFPQTSRWPWQQALQTTRTVQSIAEVPELIHSASACNKIFRRSFIRSHGLLFGEGVHFEDVYLTLPSLLRARSLSLTREVVYLYRKRLQGGSIMDGLFTRPANYWDHLRAEEELAAQLPALDEERSLVLQHFMVRSIQGFVLRAPDVLEPEELEEFFRRAAEVYQDFPHEAITAGTLDARHRIPFAALLARDLHFYANLKEGSRQVRAAEGQLVIDRYDESFDELMRLNRVHARVDGVRKQSSAYLVVSGNFNIPGLDLEVAPDVGLGIRLRGSGVTVEATVVERPDLAARDPRLRFSGFEARIPLSRVKPGLHHIRLVFMTATGQASSRTTPTLGYLRSARATRAGGITFVPRVDRWNNCQLLVGHTATESARRSWHLAELRDDLASNTEGKARETMRAARRLRGLTWAAMRRKGPIWLIGERRDTAQDNSAALFRHIRQAHPDLRAYYVLDGTAPIFDELARLGHVVRHSSWRHKWLMLHARLLVNSYDIDGYMLPDGWNRDDYHRELAWRVGSRRVFLQHGIIYNDVSAALHRSVTGLDLFVTSAHPETAYVQSQMGYQREVKQLGMPRFDTLQRLSVQAGPRVLFMPTWRSYLVAPSYASGREPARDFLESEYFVFMRSVLESEALKEALERHDATLEFLPHYEMHAVVKSFVDGGDHVVISDQRARNIQTALRECDVFVTDWSSTFFDVAYMGVPVVHAPFDEDDFHAFHYGRGFFDLQKDGFGPVARTPTDVVDAVAGYLSNGCTREELYTRRTENFFLSRDRANCERVVTALRALS